MGDDDRNSDRDLQHEEVDGAPVLPDLNPWREVGWIFRDGDCIAIERQVEEAGARVLVD